MRKRDYSGSIGQPSSTDPLEGVSVKKWFQVQLRQMMPSRKNDTDIFNEKLISEVKRNPIIYDHTNPSYTFGRKKKDVWKDIADELGEQVEFVKTRWRTLRDRYTKERRRIHQEGGRATFSYFEDLDFLDQYIIEGRRGLATSMPNSKLHLVDRMSENSDSGESPLVDLERSDVKGHFQSEESEVCHPMPDRKLMNASTSAVVAADEVIDEASEVPTKRIKSELAPHSTAASQRTASVRNLEVVRRIEERDSSSRRDSDECFAEYVLSALKEIDSESRAHARIAIIQALAQFQT